MANPKEASFRITRDINGEYRVECLDKPINFWYIVVSKLGKGREGFNAAVNYCIENFL